MMKKIIKTIWTFCSNVFDSQRMPKDNNDNIVKMKTYNAAVLFVDILGFSALTKGEVTSITQKNYEAWGVDGETEHPYSIMAATILVEFRDVLLKLKQQAIL